ncbi:hypothetical protein C8R45DRAFT_1103287 [Mycena sanguinolenta]|nr:hypothetical protein C8R45DRAFT_1103287 [Mycena sanguinolenta]
MTMRCAKSLVCTPKFYASHNFDTYQVHDTQKQRYYWIVLDGLQSGIYSLQSAAESFLPTEGTFVIVRVPTIADASFFWRDWCKKKHVLSCDPVKCENMRLQVAGHRRAPSVPDSDNEAPLPGLSARSKRRVDVLDGPAPDPDRGHPPMAPVVFPLDEKTARKLQLKTDGTRLEHGQSLGFKQQGSSRIKLSTPSRRHRNVSQERLSTEPKLPLFVDDSDDDQLPSRPVPAMSASVTSVSSLSASTASHPAVSHAAASCPAQSLPVFESVLTACSPAGGATSNAKSKGKFKPAFGASRQMEERLTSKASSRSVRGQRATLPSSAKSPSTAGQSPLNGPFYFNPEQKMIYCNLDTALGWIQDPIHERLTVVDAVRDLEHAIKSGGVLTRRGRVKTEAVKVEVKEEEIVEILDSDDEMS